FLLFVISSSSSFDNFTGSSQVEFGLLVEGWIYLCQSNESSKEDQTRNVISGSSSWESVSVKSNLQSYEPGSDPSLVSRKTSLTKSPCACRPISLPSVSPARVQRTATKSLAWNWSAAGGGARQCTRTQPAPFGGTANVRADIPSRGCSLSRGRQTALF